MNNNILGILLSFIYISAIIFLTTIIKKKYNIHSEFSRKFIHIMSGNWILLSNYYLNDLKYEIVLPICFIIINFLSSKFHLIDAMERDEADGDKSYGTVYYSISALILVILSNLLNAEYISYIGMLVMAYGDGLAALIGMKFGKPSGRIWSKKTKIGSFVVFITSFVIILFTLYLSFGRWALVESLLVALLATVLELFGSNGMDNIMVPIGTGIYAYFIMLSPFEVIIATLINLIILGFAYYKKSLSEDGGIFAFFVGIIAYALGSLTTYLSLLAFFIIGSLISHIKNERKQKSNELLERTGARNWLQVLCNSLPAMIVLIVVHIGKLSPESAILASMACFAAGLADTMSSEIGTLSAQQPVSIINWKPIKRGMSGGITSVGVLAGFVGSFVVAGLVFLMPGFFVREFMIVAMVGGFGTILDSILGASIQVKYSLEDGSLSERRVSYVLPIVQTNDEEIGSRDIIIEPDYLVEHAEELLLIKEQADENSSEEDKSLDFQSIKVIEEQSLTFLDASDIDAGEVQNVEKLENSELDTKDIVVDTENKSSTKIAMIEQSDIIPIIKPNPVVKGISIINNDIVNLIALSISTILAYYLYFWI